MITEFIGIPYKDKGNSFDGADCYGLASLFYERNFNKSLPTYGILYASSEDGPQVNDAIATGSQDGNWKEVDEPAFGDLLFFRIKGLEAHIGVSIGGDEFIHCFPGRATCIESLQSIQWNKRLTRVLRYAAT